MRSLWRELSTGNRERSRSNEMTETLAFTIGSEVRCGNEKCGTLTKVIVDPISRTLTHLVVEPKHTPNSSRLVPVDAVASSNGAIRLDRTREEFDAFSPARETEYIRGEDTYPGYREEELWSSPYFGLAGGNGMFFGGSGFDHSGPIDDAGRPAQTVTYDAIPLGEVEVRRGESVHATDGDIGHVRGLVIDPGNSGVTHILLEEGHLWGRKEVAIPIGAVTDAALGVTLNLTKSEVKELPEVAIAPHSNR
jgi:hypothetical protein